jgi:hypothetical protein
MRAYLIQAAAHLAMKKYHNAKDSCELGLSHVNNYTDTQMAKQLKEYLAVINSLTGGMPSTASQILSNQTTAAASSETTRATEASTAVSKKKSSQGGNAGKGPVERGGTEGTVTLEHLTLLRDQFIANGGTEEPGKVQRSYLARARQNLSHATGEEVLDDLIGLGYLLVNANQHKDAEDLFDVLLRYKYEDPPLTLDNPSLGSDLSPVL